MQAPTALHSHMLVTMRGPTSLSLIHAIIPSTHQPLKPHSYTVIRVFGGEMLVEYPPTLAKALHVPSDS